MGIWEIVIPLSLAALALGAGAGAIIGIVLCARSLGTEKRASHPVRAHEPARRVP